MTHARWVKWVDLLSFAVLLFLMSTGALLAFTLPAGSGQSTLWGMTRHDWGALHGWLAVLFILLMASHLITHYKCMKAVILGRARSGEGYRLIAGVVGLIALILIAVAPLVSPVDEVSGRGQGGSYGQMQQR